MTQVEHSEREKLVERLGSVATDLHRQGMWCLERGQDANSDAWAARCATVREAASALLRVGEELEEAKRKQAHTEYWYAVRLEPIKDAAKRAGIWPEIAAIIANGNGTRQLPDGSYHYDPPTYAQQLNVAEHRAEAAEARATAAEGERDELQREVWKLIADALRRHHDICDQRDEALAQNEAMRMALEFYADPQSWTSPDQANRDEMFDTPVQADNYGDRARTALSALGDRTSGGMKNSSSTSSVSLPAHAGEPAATEAQSPAGGEG